MRGTYNVNHDLISRRSDWESIHSSTEVRHESRRTLEDTISNLAINDREKISGSAKRPTTLEGRSKDGAGLGSSQGANELPPEIVEKIFHFFNDSGVVVLLPFKSENFSLWRLGHVCGRWRTILWDSPLIWGQLTVKLSRVGSETSYGAHEMFGYNLAATNDMFVYVLSKTKTIISLSAGGSECRSIFQTIISHSKRFKRLHLYGLQENMIFSMLKQPPGAWESLEALDIGWQENGNIRFDNTTSSLQSAANLRTVSFSSSPATYIPQLFFLPWAQLVELHIARMDLPVSIIYATLERCPGLVSALLSIQCDPLIPTQGKITLPNLIKLNLTTTNKRTIDWDTFLQPFLTPSLTSLSFCSQKIAIATMRTFIIKSGSSLQEFTLSTGNPYDDGEAIESLLSLLSGVKKLNITWLIPASIVRRIFTGKDGLLPCLIWGRWQVGPSGLTGILEIVDSYVSNSVGREPLSLTIGCYERPGFHNVVKAYLESYEKYQNHEGLKFWVYNAKTSVFIKPGSNLLRSRYLCVLTSPQ
ncbi:hypothetical protein BDZ94DRAFT_1324674 [Collybia nuda]|uniref:F-box domain-containing protein n=1 Tax=Collybia nuda TaxID=64659 RepID=A0A9P5Y1P5_9AGAR|nr:hypothetical protein BDZ94DRAFT_1324674 [Collybia nuda]